MLLGLCSDLLMDGKSLIIEAHEIRILFVLQTLGSTQPLLCQNCVDVCFFFILFTQSFIGKMRLFNSIFSTFVSGSLKLFKC